MSSKHIMILAVVAIILVFVHLIGRGQEVTGYEGFQAGSGPRFVMYYADWCPHCQTAKPLFKDFMGTGIVKVNGLPVKVQMKEEKQIEKGVDPDVKGYPSFLYSDAAGKIVEFSGPRTADGFMKFLETQILS